ncbi:MAG: bacterial Ig-like domain-containing protein [Clostridia bacterium]|nr:bacterial Ig-like domain-containing protein [Clostridia bacterium]
MLKGYRLIRYTIIIIAFLLAFGAAVICRAEETTAEEETSGLPESTSVTEPEVTSTPEVTSEPEVTSAPGKTVIGFTVDTGTGKTTYYEGDFFTSAGYTGRVIYSDYTYDVIDSSLLVFSPSGPLTYDVTGVTFTCELAPDTAVTKMITVIPATSIELSGSCKTDYRACEEIFNPEGLEVNLKFADGTLSAYKIPINECTTSPALDEPVPLGTTAVEVIYSFYGKELSAEVPVTTRAPLSISILSGPEALYEGYSLAVKPEDFSVTALYEGEETPVSVTAFSIEDIGAPVAPDGNGEKAVTLSFGGLEADYRIHVIPLLRESITVSGPAKHYYLGDAPSFDGLSVTVEWQDGMTADVTAELSLDIPETYSPGVTMNAAFGLVNVPLEGAVIFHEPTLTVLRQPDKTEYLAGETFDITGLAVIVTYDDGTHQQNLTSGELTVIDDGPLTADDYSVTVSWNGLETGVDVKVFPGKRILSITVTKNPDKVRYIEGEPLILDGIAIRIDYEDGTNEMLETLEDVTTDPEAGTPLKITGKPVTLRYSLSPTLYFETVLRDITITKSNIRAIAVTTQPTKQQYNEGDEFSSIGMEVSAIYDGGSMTILDPLSYSISGAELIEGRLLLREGAGGYLPVSLTVTFGDISCVFTVDVLPKSVRRITAVTPPALTEYKSGDFFNPAGLTVRVEFADGTVADLPDDYYTIDVIRPLSEGDTMINLIFRDAMLAIPITVTSTETGTETTASVTEPEVTTDTITDTGTTDTVPVTPPGTTAVSPSITTVSGGETSGCGRINTIMLLWIIIIVIIFAAIIGLIVYYRHNFT